METTQQSGESESRGTKEANKGWTALAWVALLAALAPLTVLVNVFCFVLFARWKNGHWPTPGERGPNIHFDWLWHVVGLGLMGWWVFSIIAILVMVLARSRRPDFPSRIIIPIAIFVAMVMRAYLKDDPGGFIEWFWKS